MELKEALETLYDDSIASLTALLDKYRFPLQDKERWVNLGVKELTGTDRRYKLFQMGNLGMSQPTGGFQSDTPDIDSFMKQMHKLITPEPTFVICTEPFQKQFFDAFHSDPSNPLYYEVVGTMDNSKAGILSNQKFTYSVLSETSNTVLFTLNDVKVLHWHGNSKGTTQETLRSVIDLGRSHAPVIFLGDSNITPSKLKSSSEHPLEEMLQEQQLTHTCSRIKMLKTRIPDNILYNNQITKGGQTSDAEIDGMFISVISEPFVPEPFVPDSTIHYAFTEYSEENPVIADHSVVKQKIGDFTFVCVNTASMDDPQKGFLTKKEWEGIDLQAFAANVALPYTYKWVTQLYPAFHEKMKLHGNYTPNKDDQEVEDFITKYTTTHDPQGQLVPNPAVKPLQLPSPTHVSAPFQMPGNNPTRKRRWDYLKEITGLKKGGSKKRKRLRSKRRKTSMKKRLF